MNPRIGWTLLIGTLAIAGFPPLEFLVVMMLFS